MPDGDTTKINEYSLTHTKPLEFYSYAQGTKNGNSRILVNGKTISLGQYSNGSKHKLWKFYYYNSDARAEREYNNGLVTSELFYTLNGDDPYTGTCIINYPDGSKDEVKIKNGLRNGRTTRYDKMGNEIERIKYKNGEEK